MITRLSISNFILIDTLDIEVGQGMTVLTGETGAGKSILLGALGAALGNRMSSKGLLKDPSKKAIVEVSFQVSEDMRDIFESKDFDYEPTTVFRRELLPTGKSRGFINDTPAKSAHLNFFASLLVDINSQSDSGLLQNVQKQLGLIDSFESVEVERAAYAAAFKEWKDCLKELDLLKSSNEENDLDYLEFLYHELDKANVKKGEVSTIENTLARVKDQHKYSERIEELNQLYTKEGGVMDQLFTLESKLQRLAIDQTEFENELIELQSVMTVLQHLEKSTAQRVSALNQEVDVNVLQERLSKIKALVRKHKLLDADDLVDKFDELAGRIQAINHKSSRIKELTSLIRDWSLKVQELGNTLHVLRIKASTKIQQALTESLASVDLPKARLELAWEEISPTIYGCFKPVFKFSANPGTSMEVLSKVASGGEMSRVKLALKSVLSQNMSLSCQIFDEIDTGVSGSTAERLGASMKALSKRQQVLAITHLPQVAAYGDQHWKVDKAQSDTTTITSVTSLNDSERVQEVARMLSGALITNAALKQAEVLLYRD